MLDAQVETFQPSSPDIKITRTGINGLVIFEKQLYQDPRGSTQEFYRIKDIKDFLQAEFGETVDFSLEQGLWSATKPGGMRGLHAEPVFKVVMPFIGDFFIAIADVRPESPTFVKVETFTLNFGDEDMTIPRRSFLISPGLANSLEVIGPKFGIYVYNTSDTYNPGEVKRSIRWDDPDLAIPWPITPTIMSEVDATRNPSLRELFPEKFK